MTRPIEDEKTLDSLLFSAKGVAAVCGWRYRYHVLRSKGSQAGFPDRVLVRERVIFVETKGPKTPVRPEQVAWLTALAKAGAECYLVRPADFEEISEVLARRWSNTAQGTLWNGRTSWQPNSIWTVEGCRADARAEVAA